MKKDDLYYKLIENGFDKVSTMFFVERLYQSKRDQRTCNFQYQNMTMSEFKNNNIINMCDCLNLNYNIQHENGITKFIIEVDNIEI